MRISKETKATLATLRNQGYRWTIENEVDYRLELHNEIKRLNGTIEILFVAELDGYGNVSEWGPYDEARVLNLNRDPHDADGEQIVM